MRSVGWALVATVACVLVPILGSRLILDPVQAHAQVFSVVHRGHSMP